MDGAGTVRGSVARAARGAGRAGRAARAARAGSAGSWAPQTKEPLSPWAPRWSAPWSSPGSSPAGARAPCTPSAAAGAGPASTGTADTPNSQTSLPTLAARRSIVNDSSASTSKDPGCPAPRN